MKINRPLAWIQGEDGQTPSIGWKSCAPWPGRELHDQVVCSMARLYSSRIKDVSIYRAERIQSIVNSVALVCSRVHGRSTHEACQVRVVVVVQHGLNRFKFAGILLRCINSLAEECISCILEGYIDLDCMYGVTEDRLRSCSADHAYQSSCLACVWVISFLWNQHFHIHQPAICESTCLMRIYSRMPPSTSSTCIIWFRMPPLIQHALSRNLYADLILWDPSPESDTTGSAQCYHTYNHAQLLILMGISTGSGFIHSWTYTKPPSLLSLNLHEATDSSLHDTLVLKEKNLFGVLVLASFLIVMFFRNVLT